MVRGSGSPPPDHYGTVWDPLRGQGPSSSEYYHAPLEVKSPHFPSKPGWKSLRHNIHPEKERLQEELLRTQRQERSQEAAKQRAIERHLDHGYNPVTGQEYNKGTGKWQQSAEPWAHQKASLRPKHVIDSTEREAGGPLATQRTAQQRLEALAPVVQMRKDRIANGGLSTHQRRNGGVADLLNWGS